MGILEIETNKKEFLWRNYGNYYTNIFKQVNDSYKAKSTMQIFIGFNLAERKILDNLIIKCFPKVYLDYLETIVPKDEEGANLLNQILSSGAESKSHTDLQKILEKVQNKIADAIHAEIEKKELGGNELFIALENQNAEEDYINNPDDQERLIQSVNRNEPIVPKNKEGLISFIKKSFQNYNKVQDVVDYNKMGQSEKQETTLANRQEFIEKLTLFKYYLANQFYQDNLGRVEIL